MPITSPHSRTAFALTAVLLLLTACGSENSTADSSTSPSAAASDAALPPPSHKVAGRTVTISLPYDGRQNLAWIDMLTEEEQAPFKLDSIDASPLKGSGGALGVTTYSYTASAPASIKLRFALIPAGQTIHGPPSTRFTGTPSQVYEAEVSVH